MKLKEKLKNKLNTFKNEIKHENRLDYPSWLQSNELDDNAENRGLYASYMLDVDNKNKKADYRLSQVIGRGVFLAIFIAVFIMLCINSVGATSVAFQTYADDTMIVDDCHYGTVLDLPYDYSITTFIYEIQGHYEYTYVVDKPLELYNSIHAFATSQQLEINQETCFGYFEHYFNSYSADVFDIGLDENERAYYLYLTCSEYYDNLVTAEAEGYSSGFYDGHIDGLREGFDNGYNDGLNESEIAKKSIFAIFDAPIKLLTSLLDFEIFGINLLSIFKVILTILILGAIAKFVLSIAL